MLKKILTILLALPFGIHAQEVISSQGETYTSSDGTIDFTIGEIVINTETDGSNTVTQGFHQTEWNFLTINDVPVSISAKLYPNPTTELVTIETEAYSGMIYSIVSATGSIVMTGELTSANTQLTLDQLAAGHYSFSLIDQNGILKTINLIKQ